MAATDPPDRCPRCHHDGWLYRGPRGELRASRAGGGRWYCEACDAPAPPPDRGWLPGQVATIDPDALPEACTALRYSLPAEDCCVVNDGAIYPGYGLADYGVDNYAYEYHGDFEPSPEAVAQWEALGGVAWLPVFVGGAADVPVFAVPVTALRRKAGSSAS